MVIYGFELILSMALLNLLLDHVELENVPEDLGINRLLQALKHGAPWFNDTSHTDIHLATFHMHLPTSLTLVLLVWLVLL